MEDVTRIEAAMNPGEVNLRSASILKHCVEQKWEPEDAIDAISKASYLLSLVVKGVKGEYVVQKQHCCPNETLDFICDSEVGHHVAHFHGEDYGSDCKKLNGMVFTGQADTMTLIVDEDLHKELIRKREHMDLKVIMDPTYAQDAGFVFVSDCLNTAIEWVA